jgi:hypothetical protein
LMNASSRLGQLLVGVVLAASVFGCGAAVRPECQLVMWDAGVAPPEEGAPIPAEIEPLIGPADIDWSASQFGQGATGQPTLTLALGPDGAARMAEFTRSNVGSYVAIALNGTVVVVPRVFDPIEDGVVTIEPGMGGAASFGPLRSCVGTP